MKKNVETPTCRQPLWHRALLRQKQGKGGGKSASLKDRLRQQRFAPAAAAALALLAVLGGGGCEGISQSAPVKGGSYLWVAPLGDLHETLAQGDNAKSPSRLVRSVRSFDAGGNLVGEAQTRVELGVSRDPLITVKPVPAYGQYAVAVIGALALIGGTVMAFKSWPKIGATLALGGFTVMVVALTAGQYGWLWALLAAAVFTGAAAALYSGYRSGLSMAAHEPATGAKAAATETTAANAMPTPIAAAAGETAAAAAGEARGAAAGETAVAIAGQAAAAAPVAAAETAEAAFAAGDAAGYAFT